MRRSDRLFDLISRLRDGQIHRAEDLARLHNVSVRTIYRDIEVLKTSGLPVEGTPGTGYRARPTITLPALSLRPEEMEALQLGLAIVSETTDPDLKSAANALADKIDAGLTEEVPGQTPLAIYPFSDAVRGFSHMPTIRAAIRGRQKLQLTCRDPMGGTEEDIIRPLRLAHWGRIWLLTAWSEQMSDFRDFRLDLIETSQTLPELFVDEPGKSLADAPV